jgi:hypothetical protein
VSETSRSIGQRVFQEYLKVPDSRDRSDLGQLDTVFLHARREACVILAAWACCLFWTVGYYRLAGFDLGAEDVNLTFGMPSWVFYGVLLPWIVATVFSVGFSLFVMRDDDLGEELLETEAESFERAANSEGITVGGDSEARRDAND